MTKKKEYPKKMKILIDAHVFDGKYQGSRTYIKGMYTEIIAKKKDWKFYFVGNEIENLKKEFGQHTNISYIPLKFKNKFIRLFFELPYLIFKNKIDFSHFQYISPIIKIGKYIVTNHDILFEEKRFRSFFPSKYRFINGALFKKSAKAADILLTVSEYSKNKINEIYKIKKEAIHITPNAIKLDMENLEKDDYIKNTYSCEKYILYVSRIEPRKNHISILRAFVNLKLYEQGYQIVFIGNKDIPDQRLTEFINEHKDIFENRLYFFSNIEEKELKKFYLNAELVVYPSFAEGFGIPPLEAAVYKKKVICSNATAMAEFNFFNYFVDPYNQKEIENAMLSVLVDEDDEKLNEIQKIVLESYNWSNSTKVLISLIE